MDTTDRVFACIIAGVMVAVVTLLITVGITKCGYELWIGDVRSRNGSKLDLLIESKADSILVVDPLKPEPVGVLYFKSYGGGS